MAYSTQSAVSDGTLSVLPLSIDYLSRDDITVYFGSVQAVKDVAWSWVGTIDRSIQFTPAVPVGVKVTVKRSTGVTGLYHKFSGGAQFTSKTLDESLTQTLFVAQEFSEAAGVASDDLPLPVGAQAQAGTSNKFARSDHIHVGMTGGSVGSVVMDTFTGDGVKVKFTLANTPVNKGTTQIYIDSVYQNKAVYSLSGPDITFDEAPAIGAAIEVITVTIGGGKASDVLVAETPEMLATSTGGNVQGALQWLATMLRGTTSVLNYGAKGDGLTDDSAAIQAAINAVGATGGCLYFPRGKYLIGTNLTVKSNVHYRGDGIGSVLLMTGNNRQCFNAVNVTDIEFSGLTFNGQKPNVGYETTNNYDMGIRLGEAAASRNVKRVRVRNCNFIDIGLDGIYIENAEDVVIEDSNTFTNCRRWGVVVESGTYGTSRITVGGTFDSTSATGPTGKELPLGAIDCEPYDSVHRIDGLIYRNIRSNGGDVCIQDYGSTTGITNAAMYNVRVHNARINVTNGIYVATDCFVTGTSGYFIADIGATGGDGAITQIKQLSMVFGTGRNPVTNAGRANLLGADYANDLYMNAVESSSGTGASTGRVRRNVDGHDVYIREMHMGPALGSYEEGHDLGVTVTAGDQVVMFFEIERTDAAAPNNNFFRVAYDTAGGVNMVQRIILPPVGVSTFCIAFKAPASVANPRVRWGISGVAGAAVSLLVRKNFVFVNPQALSPADFTVRPNASSGVLDNGTSPVLTINSNNTLGVNTANNTYPMAVGTSGTSTTQSGNTALQLVSNGDGRDVNIRLGDGVNASGMIGYLSNSLYLWVNGAVRLIVDSVGNLIPGQDNVSSLGTASKRMSTIYAASSTISTSDERAKQDIGPIDPAVLRAWAKVQFLQYTFRDAVDVKGDGARWHFGVVAQRVKEAFESEGLDPFSYGLLCYDEWEGGSRYGIRYEEALVLECAYLRTLHR